MNSKGGKQMKIKWILFGAILAALLIPLYANTGASDNQVILVAPFENLSSARSMILYEVATGDDPQNPKRSFYVDRYSEAPRHILEDILVSLGANVVERQRLDAILLEAEAGKLSGLIDSEKAIRIGKILGANSIIMGTITDVRTERSTFWGYGISTINDVVTCGVRIRLIDAETGTIRFSSSVQGTQAYSSSRFGGVKNSDVAYSVIENALKKLKEDEYFRDAVTGLSAFSGQGVAVQFTPNPDNSDIEIDGIYHGGSPLLVKLRRGQAVRIKISKAGYLPWEATIIPSDGFLVKPELKKE
jgi:curli biogenesis system outer membrane secretion channel CsgG